MRVRWNQLLHALVLVRIGQDLGSDSPAARAVHDAIDFFLNVTTSFFRA